MMSPRFGIGNLLTGRSDREESSSVFVASTQEAIDSGWLLEALEFAEKRLGDCEVLADFLLWNTALDPGDLTVDRLIAFSGTVGAAVVVLTGDDKTTSRGAQSPSPRDNLVLEAGIFLSQLGRDRVLILREEDSKVPSDLLGVTLPSFHTRDDEGSPSKVAIQSLGLRICEFIQSAFARAPQGRESAVAKAVSKSLDKLDAEAREVRSAISRQAHGDEPIAMPNAAMPSAAMAYVDAVQEVKETFLATTYLDSAFWTRRHIPIIEANERLVERLDQGGSAKRLILLSRSVSDELKSQRERRRSLRTFQPAAVEQMDKEFNIFSRANLDLLESGFEIKVVYDHDELWRELPQKMYFSPGETELAVFDQDRIDVYSGFARGGAPTARLFGAATHERFRTIYDVTLAYIDELWNSKYAEDFLTFEAQLRQIITESEFEVDYEPNWLLKYDDDADEGDAHLKRREMDFVLEALRGRESGSEVARHLDLGTCTGRYLAALRELMNSEGMSIGVDLDVDCIDHCKRKHANALQNERQFRVIDADIRDPESLPKERFDLVTCMMGTLCHLRREPIAEGHYGDHWQEGLQNLADRLSSDGDAFVAFWNTEVTTNGTAPLLSIYPQRSAEILLRQSPSKEEFEARLGQAGLRVEAHDLLEKRLHVYHLRHK